MTLLTALRAGTRDAHVRLEDEVDVLRRCRSRETYVPLLQAFRSVYGPLERALDVCPVTPSVVPDFAQRRKTAWLDADLTALAAPAATDAAVPELTGPADVAGTCYVLEGATLGSAVVLRRLADAGGDPLPTRFFTSYGPGRGAMWSAFRRQLAELDERGVDRERAACAARRTFRLFEQACP